MSIRRSPSEASNIVPSVDSELRARIHGILAAIYPHAVVIERRQETRYPYAHLLGLTPTDNDGATPSGESIIVVGKSLSEHGLSFYHPEPILHRRMIASLECGHGRWLGVLIDLSWCRFTKLRWYESGGRFIQVVASPLKRAW
jgi:hypothetical protein